ncbi:hypothetical protein M422DRAFT_55206 [Sphaerobolus stellatus SS14]|uniref:Unplaced genomic scaffold SPHSTscaffold_272, whole genome shotgun sequence n=1 Tax=Sphaerobolus stellatus (strain SS14) TaxID=990650 RepID=A0A0C9TD02_SPHS4|nr:hypothetical protein M422DRAFT_55206 [Sphaerobolus stellatus SS14]
MSKDDEVIVISDDSDVERTRRYMKANYAVDSDSDVQVLSDSGPPASSSLPPSSQVYDIDDVLDDDSDHEFLGAMAILSQASSKSKGSSRSAFRSSQGSSSSTSLKRKSSYSSHDSESDEGQTIQVKRPVAKRQKKTEAAKEAEKLRKAEERERKKAETAARKAAEKEAKKTDKVANRLVAKKDETLCEMIVEFSSNLRDTQIPSIVEAQADKYDGKVQEISDPFVIHPLTKVRTNLNSLGLKLVRWKRHVSKHFDEERRIWIPLPLEEQYDRTESTYIIIMSGQDIRASLDRRRITPAPSATEQVMKLRNALGAKHHIHLMTYGWFGEVSGELRDRFESELVALQVKQDLFLEETRDEADAAHWIYQMSCDLGNKPNKLIGRSHLPFLAAGSDSIKSGKSHTDTLTKMFAQLPRITEEAGKAIVKDWGTLNNIMEGYEKEELNRTGKGPLMLQEAVVSAHG